MDDFLFNLANNTWGRLAVILIGVQVGFWLVTRKWGRKS